MDIRGIDLENMQQFVREGISDITKFKNDVAYFWSGPAAESYQNNLLKTIDFSKLSELIINLEIEAEHAIAQLITNNVDT